MKKIFLLTHIFILTSLNAQFCFGPATDFHCGGNLNQVINADFNNDGKLDLAVANNSYSYISIGLGNGDGTFGTATNYSLPCVPWNIACADFNGDSNLDLAISSFYSNFVFLRLGTGTGVFTSTTSPMNVGGWVVSLTKGDFNNDGIVDTKYWGTSERAENLLIGSEIIAASQFLRKDAPKPSTIPAPQQYMAMGIAAK